MISSQGDKPKRLSAWDYAKVVGPSVLGSMALMGLVSRGFNKARIKFPNSKLFNPAYSLPKPFPGFLRHPGLLRDMHTEALVDAPITVGAMMKAQHDINKKMNKTSGLASIAQSVKKTPGVYAKARPNMSGKIRMKKGLSMGGVKI